MDHPVLVPVPPVRNNMLRRKGHNTPSGEAPQPSPLSNFTVRFSTRDAASDEYVDITQDVDEPVLVDKVAAIPPSSMGQSFPAAPTSTTRITVPHSGKDHSGPPSPVSSPVVERVSSLRDNLHNLKERFTSHRKNSDDDKEKLLPSSSESSHGGSHSPSLIGKLVRKLEERRGSGGHKDISTTGNVSPTKDALLDNSAVVSGIHVPVELRMAHEATLKSGSAENIPRTAVRDITNKGLDAHKDGDAVSIASEPAIKEVPAFESQECLPSPGGSRKVATVAPLQTGEPASVAYSETVSIKDYQGQFGGVVGKKPEERTINDTPFSALSPLLIVAGLLIAIVVVPMPSFMSGLLFGCIITATASVRIWFTVLFPKKHMEMYRPPTAMPSIVSEGQTNRQSSCEGRFRPGEVEHTWMNQMVGDFDVSTFHVNQTQSVYVSLDGSSLRLRKPKSRVVARRAMFDEELQSDTFTFTENRVYNIQGGTVSLVPQDIPRKRRWLWRFPIAIKLVDPASIATLVDEVRDYEAKKAEKEKEKSAKEIEKEEEKLAPAKTTGEKDYSTLYLLPRSDREKEDWFWKLCAATGTHKFPTLRPNLSPNLSTLNLLFHRFFYDVLTEATWGQVVKKKIQKKLSVIKLPYYIEELQITEIDLGKHLPVVSDMSQKPSVDQRGIWIECNIEYHGTVQMTLATKLNLMKLKKGDKEGEQPSGGGEHDVQMDTMSVGSTDSVGPYRPQHREYRGQSDREANIYESDEEDEFDDNADMPPEQVGSGSKLMRYVEKITESKAFQKLTDVGIVRRAMENVSDTDLTLTVVVERLAGRLAINVPHPPSDKLWYGFVTKPDLHLRAFPKLGEREVTFEQVTNWIEKKLTLEFHRLITVPNMDDLTVPVMFNGCDDLEFRLGKLSELILR